jgi:hypothetical protein
LFRFVDEESCVTLDGSGDLVLNHRDRRKFRSPQSNFPRTPAALGRLGDPAAVGTLRRFSKYVEERLHVREGFRSTLRETTLPTSGADNNEAITPDHSASIDPSIHTQRTIKE